MSDFDNLTNSRVEPARPDYWKIVGEMIATNWKIIGLNLGDFGKLNNNRAQLETQNKPRVGFFGVIMKVLEKLGWSSSTLFSKKDFLLSRLNPIL